MEKRFIEFLLQGGHAVKTTVPVEQITQIREIIARRELFLTIESDSGAQNLWVSTTSIVAVRVTPA